MARRMKPVTGAVTGIYVNTRATVPSGSVNRMKFSQTGMKAGTMTMAEIWLASRSEVVTAPTAAISDANSA